MKRVINIDNLFRFRVQIPYIWFLIFTLIVLYFVYHYQRIYPTWQNIIIGTVIALIFLLSVSARSLAQCLFAIKRGIMIQSIHIFAFGGYFRMTKEDIRPGLELMITFIGTMTNLLIIFI